MDGYDAATTVLDNQTRQEWRSWHVQIRLKKPLDLLVPLPNRLTVPSCKLVEILVTRTASPHRHASATCDVALHLLTDRRDRATLRYTTRMARAAGIRKMSELPAVVQTLLSHEPNWMPG